MRAIAFAGLPGAGKTTAVEVARSRGMAVFRMGDCVWDEVRSRSLPLDPEVVAHVASEMRKLHGPGIWAERTVERILRSPSDLVVIDGVRSMAEVEVFRREFGKEFLLVAILAPREVRHERLLQRGRSDDPKAREEIDKREVRELSWGLGEVLKIADVTIENVGTPEELARAVSLLLEGS